MTLPGTAISIPASADAHRHLHRLGNRADRILFAVPANRIGYAHGFSGGQLKIIQEIVTLGVFAIFAAIVLKEPLAGAMSALSSASLGRRLFMFVGRL